jgi:hypothetical protein
MGERSYLCARSGEICPLRIMCWLSEKCVIGGVIRKRFKKTEAATSQPNLPTSTTKSALNGQTNSAVEWSVLGA